MRIRPALTLASVAALALFATACEDPGAEAPTDQPPSSQQPEKPGGEDAENPTPQESQEPPTESADPKQPGDAGGEVDADLGKTLALGDSTLVDHVPSGPPGTTMEITVKSVKRGKLSDLANLRLDEKERQMTPYFVTSTFRYVDGAQPRMSSLAIQPKLRDGRGENAGVARNYKDDVQSCVNNRPDELAKGEDFTTCRVFLIAKDEKPSVAVYQTNFRAEPVAWKVEQ